MSELKANELRIGNYVFGVSNRVEIVCSINDDELKTKTPHFDAHHTFEIKYFKPIPLTEEWLIKFGFEKGLISTGNKESLGYTKDLIMMLRFQESDIWYACPYGYPIRIERTLHVHQLQNLYFALTGTELTHQKIN